MAAAFRLLRQRRMLVVGLGQIHFRLYLSRSLALID
jgi:hypothetical protein